MNIIFCSWNSLMETGIINGLKTLGFSVCKYEHTLGNYDMDMDLLNDLSDFLSSQTQKSVLFSINYVPVIAMVCKAHHIPYISWTVDCPCLTLYSDTISYPTNYIFLFDKTQAEKFSPFNPGHIFHLPLAFDPAVAETRLPTSEEYQQYACDVSFVGSLYSQGNKYDLISSRLPKYMQGYVSGLIAAQKHVYGYNLIRDSISDAWADEFMSHADFQVLSNYRSDNRDFVSDYFIGYKCTQSERIEILRQTSRIAQTDLYTTSSTAEYPEINNRGIADSATVMPKVFASSRINLNITLRTITSGIPLRCFDIMGMGGFLLSNYQPELSELFINGEELVMYESISDLLNKISYYLDHEEERLSIAANGQKKVLSLFSFEQQLLKMFSMLQI